MKVWVVRLVAFGVPEYLGLTRSGLEVCTTTDRDQAMLYTSKADALRCLEEVVEHYDPMGKLMVEEIVVEC